MKGRIEFFMDVEKIILKDAELYLRDITKIGKTPKSISSISLATESGLYYVPSGGGNGMPVTSHNWLVLSIVDSTNNDPVTNYVHYAISYNGLVELPHLYYMIGGTNTWVRCVTGGDIVDVMAQSWAMSNPVPSASSVKSALGDKVDKSAIVTSVSSSSTDSEVASAKVVYDRTKDSVPTSAIVTSISSSSTDSEVASAKVVYDNTSDKVPTSAIVASVSASSTDSQVASAKCVYDNLATKVNTSDVTQSASGNYNKIPTVGAIWGMVTDTFTANTDSDEIASALGVYNQGYQKIKPSLGTVYVYDRGSDMSNINQLYFSGSFTYDSNDGYLKKSYITPSDGAYEPYTLDIFKICAMVADKYEIGQYNLPDDIIVKPSRGANNKIQIDIWVKPKDTTITSNTRVSGYCEFITYGD